MLFKAATAEGIREGRITLSFRRWPKARVKAGSEIRTSLGVVGIDAVDAVSMTALTEQDAREAGHATRADLLAEIMRFGTGRLFRIRLRFAGDDARASLRENPRPRMTRRKFRGGSRGSIKQARTDHGRRPFSRLSQAIRRSVRPILPRSSAGKLELSKTACASSRNSGSRKAWRSAIACRRGVLPT